MIITIFTFLLIISVTYLAAGIIFAIVFAFRLVDRFDSQATGASLSFRLLIIPASAIFWIFLFRKLLRNRKR